MKEEEKYYCTRRIAFIRTAGARVHGRRERRVHCITAGEGRAGRLKWRRGTIILTLLSNFPRALRAADLHGSPGVL